ncbi:MAG: nitrogenase iron protein NifH [Desulfobacterota bacterium]|nr:nitrogenase iron protein NifH [Thermodesulfobacteriota bacterium]
MRQMAIYGKGGIGKSMVSSHISFALAARGLNVLHVGCDPKHDSTRLLLRGKMAPTVLGTLRKKNFDVSSLVLHEVVFKSPMSEDCAGTIYCAESGGPDPGLGCGGKGVVEAIEALKHLNVFNELHLDIVLYDVLGDVVCGGFSMPIREGHAQEIYIVTSGELEVLFAASNICKAVARFNARSGVQLGGIIGNGRELKNERKILTDFARRINTHLVGFIPYSEKIKECSGKGITLFQAYPDTPECEAFRILADTIWNNTTMSVPTALSFEELHAWWAQASGLTAKQKTTAS